MSTLAQDTEAMEILLEVVSRELRYCEAEIDACDCGCSDCPWECGCEECYCQSHACEGDMAEGVLYWLADDAPEGGLHRKFECWLKWFVGGAREHAVETGNVANASALARVLGYYGVEDAA